MFLITKPCRFDFKHGKRNVVEWGENARVTFLKGSSDAKFTLKFTGVLRFLSGSSAQAPPTRVDWQGRLNLDPPWVSWELSAIVSTPVQGKTRCLRLSDRGVQLLNVIMNIAVIIYYRHLSRWRHRGLTLLFEGNALIPICLNAYVSFMIQLYQQKKWVLGFLWIFANGLSSSCAS